MQSTGSNLEFKLNVNLRLVKPVFMQSTAGNLEFKPKVIFKLLSCNRLIKFLDLNAHFCFHGNTILVYLKICGILAFFVARQRMQSIFT